MEEVSYTWDKENRLIGVRKANGEVISYQYDSDGIRVSSTVDGVKTEYLVDKNLPYAQVLSERINNTLAASYVYGSDLISQERGTERSFYLVDGLGSTRALTNENGSVTDTYTYDAFGNLFGSTGGTTNNYRFAGEQFDNNLGDYYLRQRYYDQQTGRFNRRDSYEGSRFEPISQHKYLYANANPVSFIDPSGLNSVLQILATLTLAEKIWVGAAVTYVAVAGGLATKHDREDFLEWYIPYYAASSSGDNEELTEEEMWEELKISENQYNEPISDGVTTSDGWFLSEKIRKKLEEKHGVQPEEVDEIIKKAEETHEQDNGAKAYIQKVKRGNKTDYNVAVVNPSTKNVVTAMKGLSKKDVLNLGKNYGY